MASTANWLNEEQCNASRTRRDIPPVFASRWTAPSLLAHVKEPRGGEANHYEIRASARASGTTPSVRHSWTSRETSWVLPEAALARRPRPLSGARGGGYSSPAEPARHARSEVEIARRATATSMTTQNWKSSTAPLRPHSNVNQFQKNRSETK